MGYRLLNGTLTPSVQCQPLRSDESPELTYIRVQDHHLALDPNSLALVELDSVEDYKKIRENPPSPHIMARYKPVFKKGNVSGVKSLVIEATHDCNLACSYCFVRAYYEDHGTGNFTTFPVAKAAIDRLLNPKEKLSVGFFGGEPLLNTKLIKQVVEYVREKSKQGPGCRNCAGKGRLTNGLVCKSCRGTAHQAPSFHVTTNGTLYSHENLKYLDENGFSLITSIDGDEESHDALRPMKRSGTGSYAKIMEGMSRLVKYDISKRNTLRSTFTALMTTTIRDRLEHLNQICDDGGANWVSVEPAALSENSCFTPNQAEIEIHVGNCWDLFYDQYMDAADWWMERAKAGQTPRWHNVHKTLERIFWTVSAGSECGAGVGYMSVNNKGEIFGCHREANSYIGHIVSGIDQKLQQPWLDNRIYTRQGCMTCRQRYACGGGCREDSVGDHGDIHSPSNVHCNLKSMWVETAMKIMCECSKDLISKNCRNPARGRSGKTAEWIPTSSLPVDDNGIVLPSWVGNIPSTALVKDGLEDYGVPVELHDAPADEFSQYESAANPADPEGMLPTMMLK